MFGDTFVPGGTTSYLQLSNRPAAETNANNIFRCDAPGGVSVFVGTIATLPGGATLTYNISGGQEGAMVPSSTSQLAKMRIYNLTRGTLALILNCVVATNTLTLTANVPAGWQLGDTISIASQAVVGAPINYVDLEIISGPTGKLYMFVSMIIISAVVGDNMRLHPFEAYGGAKQKTAQAIVAGYNGINLALLKITNNVFSFGWTGTPTAMILSEEGYLE